MESIGEVERSELGLAVLLTRMLEDPGVGEVGDLADERKIVAAEARRIFPSLSVLVDPSQLNVVANATTFHLIGPHNGLDPAKRISVAGFCFERLAVAISSSPILGTRTRNR